MIFLFSTSGVAVLSDGVAGIEAIVLNVIIRTGNPFELRQVKEVKKEDEDFIKIEKDESSSDDSTSKQFASRKILEAGEKIKELEFELKKVANALKRAESENAELKQRTSVKYKNWCAYSVLELS
ncbi:hypothetical protein Droror1_Dr00018163 [Drosera rotundifolia]